MGAIRTVLWWIFIFSIPFLLISATVKVEVHCLPFYQYQYEKNHISEITGFTNVQLMMITRHLIQFFNGKVGSAQLMIEKNGKPVYLFHDHEIVHLNDVKVLFEKTFLILLVASIYFFCFLLFTMLSSNKNKWYSFWKGLRNGNALTLALLIIFSVGVLIGFHNLFTRFHYLVFGDPQSSPWILDPRTDHLVMMYPLNFWQDATMVGVGLVVIISLALIVISSFGMLGTRRRNRYYNR